MNNYVDSLRKTEIVLYIKFQERSLNQSLGNFWGTYYRAVRVILSRDCFIFHFIDFCQSSRSTLYYVAKCPGRDRCRIITSTNRRHNEIFKT